MKYKKGQVLYKTNLRTNEVESIKIVDIYYGLSKHVGSKSNFTEEELDYLIAGGTLSDDVEIVKAKAIKDLEDKFGIKLKEV